MATAKGKQATPVPEPEPWPTVGGKILELIEAQGLKMSEAAERVGMASRQQLWRILQGDIKNPGIYTVQTIVEKLGGQMKDLFREGSLVRARDREPGKTARRRIAKNAQKTP